MDASIVERLNELRQWQIEQQARLLKQQQEQREMLSLQQDRMFRALELSVQSIHDSSDISISSLTKKYNDRNSSLMQSLEVPSVEENVQDVSVPKITVERHSLSRSINDEGMSCRDRYIYKNQSSDRVRMVSRSSETETNDGHSDCSDPKDTDTDTDVTLKNEIPVLDFFMEGVAPLGLQKRTKNVKSIDDIPVPSPKKDFHTLLEEKLQNSEICPKDNIAHNPKSNVKKPFLRKGQGLARFRMSKPVSKNLQTPNSQNTSSPANTQHTLDNKKLKSMEKTCKNISANKNNHIPTGRQRLSLKNVPPPEKKGGIKSNPIVPVAQQVKYFADLSSSDLETKTQKELEEVRIFELLEEKADNSSFCSTSSTVLAFLQQSTPFKTKRIVQHSTNENKVDELSHTQLEKGTSRTIQINNQNVSGQAQNFPPRVSEAYWETLTKVATNQQNTHLLHGNACDFKTPNSLKDLALSDRDDRMYESHMSAQESEADVSLHVRFSEYNEYKTIGLTDTSSVSSESVQSYGDETAWSDCSPILDSHEVEPLSLKYSAEKRSSRKATTESGRELQEHNATQCNTDRDGTNAEPSKEYNKRDVIRNIWARDLRKNSENSKTRESLSMDESSDDDEPSKRDLRFNDDGDETISSELENGTTIDDFQKSNVSRGKGSAKTLFVQSEKNAFNDNSPATDDMIFKSELLKTRLSELEQEIDIFRKENATLSVERGKLQAEQQRLYKEFKEKEEEWERSKSRIEERLEEERKKLAREKAAFEIRIRDSQEKNQIYKLERQEVQKLKQQLDELRSEMREKESRWTAAHSRQKSQLRILKVENDKLKQEIEQLQNAKKSNLQRKRTSNYSNTKAINRINKQLDGYTKVIPNDHLSNEDEDKLVKSMENVPTNDAVQVVDNPPQNTTHNGASREDLEHDASRIAKKRDLYEHLLKEAITGLLETEDTAQLATSAPSKGRNSATDRPRDDDASAVETDRPETDASGRVSTATQMQRKSAPSSTIDRTSPGRNRKSPEASVKVLQHPDGRVEHYYPNGNVKKIFPAQGLTKMLYYNGDVCETEKDGKVKYFYASTRTWHTTLSDGSEMLEFPDGQVEKRSQNGNIEISFPDGSVRMLQPDGVEKWILPDGTIAETLPNGEKYLMLPNGQREVHTNEHKRREYPDGTVKLVYPDGTQETRYSTGRIRLKDKDGNLIMDSHL